MMALRSSGFSAGERLELAYLRYRGPVSTAEFREYDLGVCLAVQGNSNVRQSDTNVIVWDCNDSRGKTWALDRSLSSGGYFQIRYTGPVAAGQPKNLCVAGQTPGGSGTVRKIKSRVVES